MIILIFTSVLINNQLVVKSYNISNKENEIDIWTIIIAVGEEKRDFHAINSLTDLLISQGQSENYIKYITEENATKDAILTEPFEWIQESNIGEEDIVLFYFSMHGDRIEDKFPYDESDEYDEYLVPYDFDFENEIYIIDDELKERFDNLTVNNLVMIFETCYSGGMIDGDFDLKESGRIIITSCESDESSWPLFLRERWLFPHYLFKGFFGRADTDRDNYITVEEAFNYAESPTIVRSFFLAKIFSLIPLIPHEFVAQHPQIYDGWPSDQNNTEELNFIKLV